MGTPFRPFAANRRLGRVLWSTAPGRGLAQGAGACCSLGPERDNWEPGVEVAGKPSAWSEAEVAATVRSYLEMLRLEVSGEPYVKSQFRKALVPLLSNRSESAVEFKYQNVSAVLMKLGLRPIQGYQPARNYQQSLSPEVQRQLSSSPSLVELVLTEALQPPDATTTGPLDFVSANTPVVIFPEHSGSPPRRNWPPRLCRDRGTEPGPRPGGGTCRGRSGVPAPHEGRKGPARRQD